MKKIDWYILKKFLFTYFFIMTLLAVVCVVIDLAEKLDDFLNHDIPVSTIITKYYLNFIPWIVSLLSPFFIFISVIWFTSQMAYRSEVIAILNSGMSFQRYIRSYAVGATLLAALLFFGNHYVVPKSTKGKIDFDDTYIHSSGYSGRNITRQLDPTTHFFMLALDEENLVGTNFELFRYDKTGSDRKLMSKLTAKRIKYIDAGEWELLDYTSYEYDSLNIDIRQGTSIDSVLNFTPDDFTKRVTAKDQMTTPQLRAYVDKQLKIGAGNMDAYVVEEHRRTSVAFSIFLMTIIGVSIASRKIVEDVVCT